MHLSRVPDPDLTVGFYEAAVDPARWDAAWAVVCRAFKAPTGILYYQPEPEAAPRVLANATFAGRAASRDGVLGGNVDLRLQALGSPCQLAEADAIHAPSFEHGDMYAGFGRRTASPMGHTLSAVVPVCGDARVALRLQRPAEAEPFDEDERATLDGLTRHIATAVRLSGMLEAERMNNVIRAAALDRLRHGAVIVEADGVIQFANDSALQLAATGGLMLSGNGLLTCEHAAEATRLAAIIRGAAIDGVSKCMRISRGGKRAMLAAIVTPLRLDHSDAAVTARRFALVSVRDLGDTCDAAQTDLMELFGLSAAEAAILPQLLAGDSATLIAQSRGVRVATVRSQAAKVLAKSGAPNLRALASMMAALA